MELDLEADLVAELAAEADQQGFDSPEAYARWLLAHRDAVLNPPEDQLLGHLERLEIEVDRMRAMIESDRSQGDRDRTSGQAWFDTAAGVQSSPQADKANETSFQFGAGDATTDETGEEGVNEFAYSSDLEPPDKVTETASPAEASAQTEATSGELADDGADDDEIADAIADVDLAEEDQDDVAGDGAESDT